MTSQGTPNSRWYTETITTRSSDSSPTIIAIFESAKYIFGAGEATSRAFTQSGIGLRKTAGIFLSRLDVDNAGGLPGESFPSVLCLGHRNLLGGMCIPDRECM